MCCKDIIEETEANEDCFCNKTSAEENGRKFVIEIPKESKENFCRIEIDGCFITHENVEKCDFVFVRCANDDTYYVELKGQKIKKAYSQITTTIKTHFPKPKDKIFGFIVASRVPKAGQDINKLKKDFIKNYGQKLEIGTKKYIHKIS